jgi:hypothetical protein
MKIGILTQPLHTNYGGILQNYALQRVLTELGHDVLTIDREFNSYNRIWVLASIAKSRIKNRIKGDKEVILTKKDIKYIAKNSTLFINKHIKLSEVIDQDRKIYKHFRNNNYDALIVGSDQVWRPGFSPNIYNYFFDFVEGNDKIRKIAYAASFGLDEWVFNKEQTRRCSELIRHFYAVSVREESGVKLCNDFLSVQPELVLDPTMLLEQNDYLNIIKNESLSTGNGIFTYVLDSSKLKEETIKRVSDFMNCDTFNNQPKEDFLNPVSENLDDYVYPPIEKWIKSFQEADFVVTDSFHGTVFSILFNKQFIVLGNEKRGQPRFESLLNMFDLQNRMISNVDKISEVISEPINYSNVNSILIQKRKESLDFLINSLQ